MTYILRRNTTPLHGSHPLIRLIGFLWKYRRKILTLLVCITINNPNRKIPGYVFKLLFSGTLVNLKGMLYVLAYPNAKWDYGLKPILGYQLNVTNTSLSATIMFNGGVKPCGVIANSCPGQIDIDILGFGGHFVAANMIME